MDKYIYLSKPIVYIIPRVNLKVNYGYWVIMMFQCRFLLGKKKNAIPVCDVDNGGVIYMKG